MNAETPGMEDVFWLQWRLILKSIKNDQETRQVKHISWQDLVESQGSLCRWKVIQVGYVLSHLIVIKFSPQPQEVCAYYLIFKYKEMRVQKIE